MKSNWLKYFLVLSLLCCFSPIVEAVNYYPVEIGNTWILFSADGSEKRIYTIEQPENTDIEGLIKLKIDNEVIGTDTTYTDIYYITAEDNGSLMLHQSTTDELAFGIAEATFNPAVVFFPKELPLGRTWEITAEVNLTLVGPVTSISNIKVVEIEDVETPAGIFKDCVKLEITQKDILALAVLRETYYQWLAPNVGPVKYLNDQEILYEMQSFNLVEPISEDINGDGIVNILDLVLVSANFGETGANIADINADGVVNIADLVQVAGKIK